MSVTKDQVAALYAAVFNRAPDQEGLNFWVGQDNFVAIAEGFVAHPVFEAEYGEKSNLEFVQSIYENVLNGQGDAEGIEFWVNLLDSGASKGEFLANFLDAALGYEGDDADALLRQKALENKVAVALYYTETMGEASNLSPNVDPSSIDVAQDPVYKQSQEILSNVTADEATVVAAKAQIDAFAPRDEGDLVEALESYQDALDVQADAVDAEQAAAKAADDAVLEAGNKPAEGELYDVEAVTGDLEDAVKGLADDALAATGLSGSGSMQLNAATIALARQDFEARTELAQKEVSLLKAQNKSAVALQEKLQAYDDFADQANINVEKLKAAVAIFGIENGKATSFSIVKAEDKDEFSVTVTGLGSDVEFTAKNGKLVVVDTNDSEGLDALEAAVQAVYGNIAAQAAAEKAIATAAISALRDAGYKVYAGADAATATSATWADVTIVDGKLAPAKAGDTATYTLAAGISDGAFVNTSAKPAFEAKFDTDGDADGDVIFTAGEIATGTGVVDAGAALNGADATTPTDGTIAASVIGLAATASADAVEAVSTLEKGSKAFEDALAEYQEAADLLKALTAATKDVADAVTAVEDAIELFEDLGVNLVIAEDGVATGELYNENAADQEADLFVYATSLSTVDYFDGPEDVIYFGDKAAAFVLVDEDFDVATDQLGGDNNVLEIFAYQDGDNTVLYVEKAAFAGNSANAIGSNDDLVKITLTGVQADELQLSTDGFLGFIG